MSRQEIKLSRKVRQLEELLRPFTKFTHISAATAFERGKPFDPNDIFVPTEGDVWLYVGHNAEGIRKHLHTDDFERARSYFYR